MWSQFSFRTQPVEYHLKTLTRCIKRIHFVWFCCHSTREQAGDSTREKPLENHNCPTEQTEGYFLFPQLLCAGPPTRTRKPQQIQNSRSKSPLAYECSTFWNAQLKNYQKTECFCLGLLIGDIFSTHLFCCCKTVEWFSWTHHSPWQRSVLHPLPNTNWPIFISKLCLRAVRLQVGLLNYLISKTNNFFPRHKPLTGYAKHSSSIYIDLSLC